MGKFCPLTFPESPVKRKNGAKVQNKKPQVFNFSNTDSRHQAESADSEQASGKKFTTKSLSRRFIGKSIRGVGRATGNDTTAKPVPTQP